MKKTYYLFNPGRLERRANSLCFLAKGAEKAKYLPVEGVEQLYVFGSLDANSELYNFLGQKQISVHFFDYYEHYRGSFQPKDYLLAGQSQIAQTAIYLNKRKRLYVAKQFLEGGSFNMLANLKYYQRRGLALTTLIEQMESYRLALNEQETISSLMGIEGNFRQEYYRAFELIIQDFSMRGRAKQPPGNEVNALMSFCNMLLYTAILDQIYHSQLNPTISYLHEPGVRRYSLALDISEVFKPVLVDRLMFSLFNKKQLQKGHFRWLEQACFLNEKGKKVVLAAWDKRLQETVMHPTLGRKVSYKQLLRQEAYKLMKYILGINEVYKPYHFGQK